MQCTHFSTAQAQFHLLAVTRKHFPIADSLSCLFAVTCRPDCKTIFEDLRRNCFGTFWFRFVARCNWARCSILVGFSGLGDRDRDRDRDPKKRIRKYVHVTIGELRVLAICHPRPEQFKVPWGKGHTRTLAHTLAPCPCCQLNYTLPNEEPGSHFHFCHSLLNSDARLLSAICILSSAF